MKKEFEIQYGKDPVHIQTVSKKELIHFIEIAVFHNKDVSNFSVKRINLQ